MKRLVRIMLLTVLFALLAASAAQALTIYGTSDPDEIDCCPTDDIIYGYGGGDDINSGEGDDSVYGGGGNDRLVDYAGEDTDTLRGQAGRDRLNDADNDGRDTIIGGKGYDVCIGDRRDEFRGCEVERIR